MTATPKNFALSKKAEIVLAGILAVFLVAVLTFKLGEVPAGLHVDEAGMAYDAMALAKDGMDRFGYHNPVYLINFGGGQNALYTYLASIVVRVFGFSIWAIRIPAVVMALVAAGVFYALMRRAKGKLAALTSLALMAILPFAVMHARWGLESYLLFPMMILAVAALWWALNEHKMWQFVLAGILLGVTLYTYAVSYVILPIFLAIVIIYALVTKRMRWMELVALAVPLGLLALPLMLMLAVNQGWLGEISTPFFSVPKMWFYRGGEFSLWNIGQNLHILAVIFGCDFLRYNASAKFGTMYYVSVPLVVLGIGLMVRQVAVWARGDKTTQKKTKGFSLDAMMLALLVASFGCAMIMAQPNINKINAIFVPLIYALVVAIVWLYRRWRWSLMVLGIIYAVGFGCFAKWYFWEYPVETRNEDLFLSMEGLAEALDFAKTKTDGEIVAQVAPQQPYIYVLLADGIEAEEFRRDKVVENNGAVRVGRYNFVMNPEAEVFVTLGESENLQGLQQKQFGDFVVYFRD